MALWHWLTTLTADSYWLSREDSALIAIASVAAVAWTGGLIAWQIKQFTYQRSLALDILATAFMGALLGLFMHPLTYRFTAAIFFFVYLWVYIRNFYRNRNVATTKALVGAEKYPALSEDQWAKISLDARANAAVGFLTLILFLIAIALPYPRAIAWLSAIALFLGYTLVLYVIDRTPDKLSQEATQTQLLSAIAVQLSAIKAQLDTIIAKR